MICPGCHSRVLASARAALAVLADSHATPTDRDIAADVLTDDAYWLGQPITERDRRS